MVNTQEHGVLQYLIAYHRAHDVKLWHVRNFEDTHDAYMKNLIIELRSNKKSPLRSKHHLIGDVTRRVDVDNDIPIE